MSVQSPSISRAGMSLSLSYQALLLRVLSKMKTGRLELVLPSGESLRFGSSDLSSAGEIALIKVRSPRFFKRCVLFGDIGFGESFMEGEWETDSVTRVIRWMIQNRDENPGVSGSRAKSLGLGVLRGVNRIQHLFRDNDQVGSVKNISAHYDLGNELFSTFLDSSMMYSSADYSSGAQTLEAAQEAKLDRLAHAVQVRPGDHVLEIGGGWGAFAVRLAKKYGCRVTTITVSREQLSKIKERVSQEGLGDLIDARFEDYRNVKGQFDKVVSIEMIEAVGHRHLPHFFETVERVLKPQGLFGIQAITSADSRYNELRRGTDWIQKHIFPGSLIPSLGALGDAARRSSRLQTFALHDMGLDYARTLKTWRERFNSELPKVKALGFDDRFVRAWNYYFSYCEAAFAERHISVVQVVYTRPNNLSIRS